MNVVLIVVCLIAFLIISILLVRGGADLADHYEMLSIAVSDYLKDPENFDISHYPDVTEEDIQKEIKTMIQAKKSSLQSKCNYNTDFIFDE